MPSSNGAGRGLLTAPNNSMKARVNHIVSGHEGSSSSGLFPTVANSNLTAADRMGFAVVR